MILPALYRGDRDAALAAATGRDDLDVFEAAALDRPERLATLLDADPALVHARSDDGFTALHYAAFFGGPSAARVLVDRGADAGSVAGNPTRVQPLHSAAAARAAGTARILLDAGADPDARQQGGFTPLHAAGQHGDEELARLLLDAGARPDLTTDDGRTAAELARAAGHDALAALLAT